MKLRRLQEGQGIIILNLSYRKMETKYKRERNRIDL